MGYQTIDVRRVTPVIGAEVHGVDLTEPLGNQQFQEIHDALMDNLVIFFRDQKLSVDQHADFGRKFGKLHIHPASRSPIEGHPEILLIKADETSKRVAGEVWHSDVSCDIEPPMGSILHLQVVRSDGGGDTMVADMDRAYEALSEPIRKMLVGVTAMLAGEHVYRGRYGVDDEGEVFARAEHASVRTGHVAGRQALYVG